MESKFPNQETRVQLESGMRRKKRNNMKMTMRTGMQITEGDDEHEVLFERRKMNTNTRMRMNDERKIDQQRHQSIPLD